MVVPVGDTEELSDVDVDVDVADDDNGEGQIGVVNVM